VKLAGITLPVALSALFLSGCYTYESFSVDQKDSIDSTATVYQVQTRDGRVIRFAVDSLPPAHWSSTGVVQKVSPDSTRTIPYAEIRNVFTFRDDPTGDWITAITGCMVFLGVLFLLWSHSGFRFGG
jgi:hypothetical protein